MAKSWVYAFVFIVLTCSAQQAGNVVWAPPVLFGEDVAPPPTVPKEMIASMRFSGTSVVLETTMLKDIAERFGSTTGYRGDASTADEWLCFRGHDAHGDFALWLESGEIDGGSIGSFQLKRFLGHQMMDHRCKTIVGSADQIRMAPKNLRLGMKEERILQLLGAPTTRRKNTFIYEHEHDMKNGNGQYTSSNSVVIVFSNHVVQAIGATKIDSN